MTHTTEERATLAISVQPPTSELSFPVTAITPGAGNGLIYSAEVLAQSVQLWEQISVFVDHAGLLDTGRAGGRSIRDLAGVFHSAYWDEATSALRGTITLLPTQAELAAILSWQAAQQGQGRPCPKLGLSADLQIERRAKTVVKIQTVYSLDIVMNPARGGSVTLARKPRKGDHAMTEEVTTENVTLSQDQTPPQENESDTAATIASFFLDTALHTSTLAPTARQLVRDRLAARPTPPTPQDIQAEIRHAEQISADLLASRTVQRLGIMGAAPEDRIQLAFDRLMGLQIPDSASDTPRLSGIREFYILCTGDAEIAGHSSSRAALANMTTATMTSIVKNALNKALVAAYEMRPQWWKPIVWEEDFPTLQDVTWITLGGFADLPTVAEGADYTEIASPSDIEETSSFLKKGGYAAITLEMIDRDDVGAMRAIPRKIGLAAARTLSTAISNVFTANAGVGPTLGQDSTALFDAAGHGNLGTTALSLSTWQAAIVAMYKQAEPVSAKRLGLRPRWLVVPIDLEKTGLEILTSAELIGYGGGTNTVSAAKNVLARTGGVVVCPDFTNANNWAAVADPTDAPGICLGYRYGRAPELFVAADPLTGSMFTSDVMRIKARFIYTVGIGEYRALYKANI